MITASRWIPLFLAVLWVTPSAVADTRSKERAGTMLLSVAGKVLQGEKTLTAAAPLPSRSRLDLGDGAAAYALVPAGSDHPRQLAVAMAGSSSVELLSSQVEVTLLRGRRLALSGTGTLRLRGWRIELEGSLLLQDYMVYVTYGQAKVEPANFPQDLAPTFLDKVFRGLGSSRRSPSRSILVVKAGQAAHLELGGGISIAEGEPPEGEPPEGEPPEGEPPAEGYGIWRNILVSPPWIPPEVGTVSPSTVAQAQQLTRQQLQAQRESASCGCTESSGSGGPAVGSGVTVTPVERTNTPVRVRITGMPRRIE